MIPTSKRLAQKEIPNALRASEAPQATAMERMRMTKRRMAKAERDERMDITKALTPAKTYMGGFTRPTDLRASNWFSGGRYVEKNKVYEVPPASAYEPHTVFLLESRYLVKHGIGRADSYDHVVGVCREGDFPAILAKFNSRKCPSDELACMDNARWPFLPPKRVKRTIWWEKDEDPQEVVRQILEKEEAGVGSSKKRSHFSPKPDHAPAPPAPKIERWKEKVEKKMRRRQESASLLSMEDDAVMDPSSSSHYRRTIHFSAIRPNDRSSDDSPSSSFSQRANIPTSSWSRPPKDSQDAHDHIVPTYYIERKRQREMISERKEEEGGLMAELSAGILSEGVAAQIKVLPEKIPVEIKELDGTIRHPSGFEPPTPETEFHPLASKTATEDDPLLTTIKIPWDEALSPSTDASVTLPAGVKGLRGYHTSADLRALEVPHEIVHENYDPPPHIPGTKPTSSPEEIAQSELNSLRGRYMPTLSSQPFWRPLLTLTVSTRPIALTVSRLSKGLPRGLPFYASISEDDRKISQTLSARMRSLRLKRMSELALDLAGSLQGQRGGLIGVRFDVDDKGRGIEGEGFDKPLPFDKRTVKVGVGEWYPFADELKEGFDIDAKEADTREGFEIFGLDEFGQRTDGVKWPEVNDDLFKLKEKIKKEIEGEQGKQEWTAAQKAQRYEEYCQKYEKEFALAKVQKHPSVMYA